MGGAEDPGSKLRRLGVHQGAAIEVSPGSELAALLKAERTHAVFASQDCDIVAKTATEPSVDLLPASLSDNEIGELRYGKHPRRLCLELSDGQFATLDVRDRRTVAKAVVAKLTATPPLSCSFSERKVLGKWLAKRYARPAFPDEFNARLDDQKKKFAKLSKRHEGRLVTAIFLMLHTEDELPDGEDYEVVAWLACRTEALDDPKKRLALEKHTKQFADALTSCSGIQVIEHELRGERDISLEDLCATKRFDFDFRSDAPEPGGDKLGQEP